MKSPLVPIGAVFAFAAGVAGAASAPAGGNFPYEAIQLTEADIGNFSAIAFGNATAASLSASNVTTPACRAFPGSANWPSATEWAQLNASMGGGLLHPTPPGAVCYAGAAGLGVFNMTQCFGLLFGAFGTRLYIDDPLTVLSSWPQGDTCPPTMPGLDPRATCTQGGFPEYVVNVSTVKQVQAAVNFARNKNVRLVIK